MVSRAARAALVALVGLAACSSRATAPAVGQKATVDPPAPAPAAGSAARDAAASGPGDVQIRVEWHDVPVIARASPGRTTCGTARAPAVAPTTTWGIPDVFVALAAPGAPAPADARVTLDRCALVPRAIAAGASVAVTTTAASPVALAIARRGALADPMALVAGEPRPIELPVAGHEVDVPLEPGGLYELSSAGADPAWIVAGGDLRVAVTDATGQAVMRDVPSGTYPVTAWLPPRAGQPGRVVHGEAVIAPGALAEVTLDLAP